MGRSRRSNSKDGEGIAGLSLMAFAYLVVIFFNNINMIFISLLLCSAFLVVIVIIFSCYKLYKTEYDEATEIFYPAIFLLIGAFIAMEIYDSIPHDLVNVFQKFQIHEFIFQRKLSEYGQDLAFDIFFSTVGVMFIQIFNAYHIGKKIFYNSRFYGYIETGFFFFINILLSAFSLYIIKIGFWR